MLRILPALAAVTLAALLTAPTVVAVQTTPVQMHGVANNFFMATNGGAWSLPDGSTLCTRCYLRVTLTSGSITVTQPDLTQVVLGPGTYQLYDMAGRVKLSSTAPFVYPVDFDGTALVVPS